MSKQLCRWSALSACLLLANCGTSAPSGSEPIAQRQARVVVPPQVSPAFAVDDATPTLDIDATVLNVDGSGGGGYLLTYGVNHTAAGWSRAELAFVSGLPGTPLDELVFVHWDPASGAPKTLSRLRVTGPPTARAVDIDSGWLVVYQAATDIGAERHAVVLSRDGSLTPPTDLPAPCPTGIAGLTRGGSLALVTDVCGTGFLLNFSGQLVSTVTIVPPPVASYSASLGSLTAFNGIDYLFDYGSDQSQPDPKSLFAVPVTPTGAVGTSFVVALPRVAWWGASISPFGVVANGNAFLTLIRQLRGAVSGVDTSYRIATEAADHTFTLGAERYLPGGPNSTASAPTDLGATALALNGQFVIARTKSTGQTELIYPSADPNLADVTQPLTLGLPLTSAPSVSSDSQSSDGTRLLFASGAQAVRFDASLQAIDARPAELVKALHQQFMPSFAFAGQHYFAAWAEGGFDANGAITKIFGRRLSASGALLDSAPVQLTSGLNRNVDPLVVGNPSFFATVTNDYSADSSVLSNVASPVLTTAPAPPLSGPEGIAVTADGTSLTAAFFDRDGQSLKLRRLDGTGTWGAAVRVTDSYINWNSRIAVVFGGGQYVVLWTSAGDPGQRVVYGVRVSSALVPLDDPPKELLRFNCPDNPSVPGRTYDSGLQLIVSGDHLLFSWADINDGVEGLHIARLSNGLDLLDTHGVLVATQPFEQTLVSTRRVALGWDGSKNWVVWRDNEGGARPGLATLRGRRFFDALGPDDESSFAITNDLDELSKVTLAVGDGSRSLVGYTSLSSDYSYRVQARFLSSAPFPDAVPCSDASQCQNGVCATGLCSSVGGAGGTGAGGTGAAGTSSTIGGGSGASDSNGGGLPAGNADGGAAGDAGNGGEATGDAGATEAGGGHGGATSGLAGSPSGANAGGAGGAAGSTTSDGGSGSGNHGCSMRVAAAHSSRASLTSLAGLLGLLSWLRSRRRRSASAPRDPR